MKLRADAIVSVVDDDLATRRAVSRVLGARGYEVLTFDSGHAYLAGRRDVEPNCLVADIRMPGLDGLGLQTEARRLGLEVPTIFMTASSDPLTIVQAMKSGACDLLLKPFTSSELLSAVDVAVRRGRVTRDERSHLLALWARARLLTPREAEVAALVASGRLNKQIAALIGTTEKTVKVHRARAMQKLGVASLVHLVRTLDELLAARRERVMLADGNHSAPQAVDTMARAIARVSGPTQTPDEAAESPDATKAQYVHVPPKL